MIGYLFCHLRLRGTQLENKYVLGSYSLVKIGANHALAYFYLVNKFFLVLGITVSIFRR